MAIIGPERKHITFKYRPNFVLTIFINVLLYLLFFSFGHWEYFKSPYLYIGTLITIVVPLLIAFSREIQITETGINIVNLWGIDKTEVRWDEVEEGFIVSKSVREERSNSFETYSAMTWVANRMLGTVIKLIVEMRNPIIINTRNINQSKELIDIISSSVNIQPNL